MNDYIDYADFEKVKMHVGVIVEVNDFPRAKRPAYKVVVDFGEPIGRKQSSVQATNYEKESLLGMQIVAVLNFPPKNIAGFQSEILILGVSGADGGLSLLTPSLPAVIGQTIY